MEILLHSVQVDGLVNVYCVAASLYRVSASASAKEYYGGGLLIVLFVLYKA